MDKLRKLGVWLWRYKERIVLLIVVGVLCYRVYNALFPPPPEDDEVFRPPTATPTAEVLPPTPDPQPKTLIPADRKELAKNNPFWYYAGETGDSNTPEEVDLELRGIQTLPDGGYGARIKSEGRSRYYSVGDVINERYELVSIDSENETVKVRAGRSEDLITLRME